MENSTHKSENIEKKYLNSMQKKQKKTIFKGKNGLLELEKLFTELKDRELKDGEVKIKRDRRVIF